MKTITDTKLWEMNCLIIRHLGSSRFREALVFTKEICDKNEVHDMITSEASRALCRIERSGNDDVDSVLQLLSFGNFAVVNGALKSLGQDKIIPVDQDINSIIEILNSFEPKKEKGFADVRVGLALACAGWEKRSIVTEFLDSCLLSEYSPLVKVAGNALKGKYTEIE